MHDGTRSQEILLEFAYLSYAVDVLKDMTKPRTVPSTVSKPVFMLSFVEVIVDTR